MFMGGTMSQWIELIQYSIFVLVLFIGIGFVSVKLNNIFFGSSKNNKINKVKNKKKQIFFDVA